MATQQKVHPDADEDEDWEVECEDSEEESEAEAVPALTMTKWCDNRETQTMLNLRKLRASRTAAPHGRRTAARRAPLLPFLPLLPTGLPPTARCRPVSGRTYPRTSCRARPPSSRLRSPRSSEIRQPLPRERPPRLSSGP